MMSSFQAYSGYRNCFRLADCFSSFGVEISTFGRLKTSISMYVNIEEE